MSEFKPGDNVEVRCACSQSETCGGSGSKVFEYVGNDGWIHFQDGTQVPPRSEVRLSLRSAPAPESATGEGELKKGDWCEGECHPTKGSYPGTHTGALFYTHHCDGWSNLEIRPGIYRTVSTASLRKSPPPPEARDAGKTSSRSVSAESKPKVVGVSDPYRTHRSEEQSDGDRKVTAIKNREQRDERIAALRLGDSLDRLAAKRSTVLAEMDRPLPRTWRTKMGVLVGFGGPVGKGGRQ